MIDHPTGGGTFMKSTMVTVDPRQVTSFLVYAKLSLDSQTIKTPEMTANYATVTFEYLHSYTLCSQ